MTGMWDRMVRGELHRPDDPELTAAHTHAQQLLQRLDTTTDPTARDALLRQLLRYLGTGAVIAPGFRCEYGQLTVIGPDTVLDPDCYLLDAAPIHLGAACRLGPRVQLLAASPPVDPTARRHGWRHGKPIVLADNVMLGAGVIVCPGVTIGTDTVVGAGSVVTRDLPSHVVATGTPARPRRHIDALDLVTLPEA